MNLKTLSMMGALLLLAGPEIFPAFEFFDQQRKQAPWRPPDSNDFAFVLISKLGL